MAGLDFKSSCGSPEGGLGGFDSHAPPPKRIYRTPAGSSTLNIIHAEQTSPVDTFVSGIILEMRPLKLDLIVQLGLDAQLCLAEIQCRGE